MILQGLLKKPQGLYAMVLSPTRELAIQIAEQFEALGSGIGVKCAVLVGGVDMMAQAIALGRRPHVIVGTPGRVVDHLSNTKVQCLLSPMLKSQIQCCHHCALCICASWRWSLQFMSFFETLQDSPPCAASQLHHQFMRSPEPLVCSA